MRLPRDLSGDELAHRLGQFGYAIARQKGSHMRLTTQIPSANIMLLSQGTIRSASEPWRPSWTRLLPISP